MNSPVGSDRRVLAWWRHSRGDMPLALLNIRVKLLATKISRGVSAGSGYVAGAGGYVTVGTDWGPQVMRGDKTTCASAHVSHGRKPTRHQGVTSGNALPRFTGGQVVDRPHGQNSVRGLPVVFRYRRRIAGRGNACPADLRTDTAPHHVALRRRRQSRLDGTACERICERNAAHCVDGVERGVMA